MKRACRIVAVLVGVVLATQLAWAYSNRGRLSWDLFVLAEAIRIHEQEHRAFPTDDIRDPAGKPLLSWRVRLLAYFSSRGLYQEFHLDEPWDSPHNRQFIPKMPEIYQQPFHMQENVQGKTCVVALRGPSTFFGVEGDRKRQDIGSDWGATAMIVEAELEHAVVWTKPEDLLYDPANPTRGLSKFWQGRFFPEQGGFIVFADRKVRLLPQSADPNVLRRIFSIESGEPIGLSLDWYAVLDKHPLGTFMGISLFLSAFFIAVALVAAWRLVRGLAISSGELLCFVIGAQQLFFVCAFMRHYRYEVFPWFYELARPGDQFWLLAIPTLGGTVAALTALVKAWSARPLRWIWGLTTAAMGILLLDSMLDHQSWPAEESLVIVGRPLVQGSFACAIAVMTAMHPRIVQGRPFWHWLGLFCVLIPPAWFAVWWFSGLVQLRPVFGRILG